jgi:hypothetical protein
MIIVKGKNVAAKKFFAKTVVRVEAVAHTGARATISH